MDLLQILRRHQRPISGQVLSDELEIGLRTLYRDIAVLQAMGADIEGEPGVGYVLRPGFFLPPLMLSQSEIEALMLGMRWVNTFGDRPLADAATDALAKIESVLPQSARDGAGAVPMRVGPPMNTNASEEDLSGLRDAIRRERKLELTYRDTKGEGGTRVIWPFAIGYFTDSRILVGWCEARHDYRHFRTDGIIRARVLTEGTPQRRHVMFAEWQRKQMERERHREG